MALGKTAWRGAIVKVARGNTMITVYPTFANNVYAQKVNTKFELQTVQQTTRGKNVGFYAG